MKKPTLILLPALMCDDNLFKDQTAKLSEFCNVVIPVLKDYNNIKDAADYVLSIAPREFFLAGISMGGYIAMEMVTIAASRIKKLCLMATKIEEDTEKQKAIRLAGIKQVELSKEVTATKSYLATMLHNKKDDEALYETIQNMNKNLGADSYINQQNIILSRKSLKGKLKHFLNQTLIIAGINDTVTPLSLLEDISKEIPNNTLVSLANCGHLIPLDQPEATAALLEYFVKLK